MKVWEHFLSLQEQELGIDIVKKWLRPLKVLTFDACNLYLEAEDPFQLLWFEEHIRDIIINHPLFNQQRKIKIHLSLASPPPPSLKKKKEKKREETSINSFSLLFSELDPHCSFENFIASEGNCLAYRLLSKMDPKNLQEENKKEIEEYNPLFLYGPTGVGKSHLLNAIAHAMKAKGLHIIYTHAETFTEHVVTAIRAGAMSTFRQEYRNVDLLCLDDVHLFSKRGATQEEFFHTFNTLHLAGKQIILSSNCAPQELQMIEPRLVSRFEWGLVLPLTPLKKEEIILALQAKTKALRCHLSSAVIDFLMKTFTSNLKALIRALEALILRFHLQKNSNRSTPELLTVTGARQLLSDLIQIEELSALTPDKIVYTIAKNFGIKTEDILGKAQTRDCVLPRQMAMFICRNKLNMSFVKIGEFFSRDHSTVISSVKQIQNKLAGADQEVPLLLSKILNALH